MRLNEDTVKALNDVYIYIYKPEITFPSQFLHFNTFGDQYAPVYHFMKALKHSSAVSVTSWKRMNAPNAPPPLQGHFPDKEPTHGSISTLDSAIYFFSNLQVFQRYPVQPPDCATQWAYVTPKCSCFIILSGPVLPSTSEKFHRDFGQMPSATNKSVATLKWGKDQVIQNATKYAISNMTGCTSRGRGMALGPPLSLAGPTNAAGRGVDEFGLDDSNDWLWWDVISRLRSFCTCAMVFLANALAKSRFCR